MPSEAENQLADAMRRAVETTQFDPRSVTVAKSTVRRHRRVVGAAGTALALASASALVITMFDEDQGGGDGTIAATSDEVHVMTQSVPADTYPSLAALLHGTLVVTDAQCLAVYLPSGLESRTYNISWPYGFTAKRDGTGRAVLYDADGQPVATEGDDLAIGGGLMPEGYDPQPEHPCSEGEIWSAAPDVVNESAAEE